jgi:hypothetical protein
MAAIISFAWYCHFLHFASKIDFISHRKVKQLAASSWQLKKTVLTANCSLPTAN